MYIVSTKYVEGIREINRLSQTCRYLRHVLDGGVKTGREIIVSIENCAKQKIQTHVLFPDHQDMNFIALCDVEFVCENRLRPTSITICGTSILLRANQIIHIGKDIHFARHLTDPFRLTSGKDDRQRLCSIRIHRKFLQVAKMII